MVGEMKVIVIGHTGTQNIFATTKDTMATCVDSNEPATKVTCSKSFGTNEIFIIKNIPRYDPIIIKEKKSYQNKYAKRFHQKSRW